MKKSGEKIKSVARIVLAINSVIIIMIFVGALMFSSRMYNGGETIVLYAVITSVILFLISWITSLLITAFGDLVISNQRIVELLEYKIFNIENKKKTIDKTIIKEECEIINSHMINNSFATVKSVGEKEEINADKQISNDKAVNEIQNSIILTNKDLDLLKESIQKNDRETIGKIMGKRFYTFKDNSVCRYSILSVDKNVLFCLVEEFKTSSNKSYIIKADSNQENIDINNLPYLYEDSNKIFDKVVETLGIETSEKELKIIKKDLIEK